MTSAQQTAFPLTRFQRVGATPAQITTLQSWWSGLTPAQQQQQVQQIQSMHDTQVSAIVAAGSNTAATATVQDAELGDPHDVMDFQPNTRYPANFVITNGGHMYRAKVGFVSGATFNLTDWTQVSG